MQATPEELSRKLALPEVKVSLGCGLHAKEPTMGIDPTDQKFKGVGPSETWINQDGCENQFTDVVSTWDSIPLADKCADIVEMGDIVEHLEPWNRDRIWKEWTRIMKIGCKIRVSTPNLHKAAVAYANGDESLELFKQQIYAWGSGPYEHHYVTYTVETLTQLLKDKGFDNIDFSETPGVSGRDKSMGWWLVASAVKTRDI